MKKKLVFASLAVAGAALLTFLLVARMARRDTVVLAQGTGSEIVLYTGENFTGRTLHLSGTTFDFPEEQDPDGSFFDWNDQVRSAIVLSGTWRLYQNGRCNTRLDGGTLETFDVRSKLPAEGWSALVSASSTGRLEISDLAAAGIGQDISSVELVSATNLPDWSLNLRTR